MTSPTGNRLPIYRDLLAVGAILFYSVLCAAIRLAASPTMESDEAEQFLAAAYSWPNYNQPPLYTIILKGIYSITGISSMTLIGVKFIFMFFFFFSVYLIARNFWKPAHSLIVTASLSLYFTYSYDFARQLTHTVLVSFLASAACLLYLLLMDSRKKVLYYAAFGIIAGLGVLAKYNFIFFLSALVLASCSCADGRKVIRNKGVLIAIAAGIIIVAPHYLKMLYEGFPAVSYALTRTGAGRADFFDTVDSFHFVKVFFVPVLPFMLAFLLFFGASVIKDSPASDGKLSVLRWLGFYSLLVPFMTHMLLGSVLYNERWLAPVFFLVPISLFSYITVDANQKKISYFGYLCLAVIVFLVLFRSAAGFFPDFVGKVERIHMPFRGISLLLKQDLKKAGVADLRDVTVASDYPYVTANIAAELPGVRTADLSAGTVEFMALKSKKILIWKAKKRGDIPAEMKTKLPANADIGWLNAPYVRSKKFPPATVGYCLIP